MCSTLVFYDQASCTLYKDFSFSMLPYMFCLSNLAFSRWVVQTDNDAANDAHSRYFEYFQCSYCLPCVFVDTEIAMYIPTLLTVEYPIKRVTSMESAFVACSTTST